MHWCVESRRLLARVICPRHISSTPRRAISIPRIRRRGHSSSVPVSAASPSRTRSFANSTIMSYDHLLIVTSSTGVRTITLNRPERLNAVNPRLAEELPRAIDDAARDDAVRVVVITGAGRGFCSGLDLSEPPRLPEGDLRARLDPLAWVGRWVLTAVQCEKPLIAAINGSAAGAGFGLALAGRAHRRALVRCRSGLAPHLSQVCTRQLRGSRQRRKSRWCSQSRPACRCCQDASQPASRL